VTEAVATLCVAFVSGLLPIVNLEAYLGGFALLRPSATWPATVGIAAVAALGQVAGKMLYYLAGRGVLALPARLQLRSGGGGLRKAAEYMQRLRQRFERRPWLAFGIVAVSAAVGLPPFGIVSAAAGVARVPVLVFLLAGFLGRWGRFVVVLWTFGAITA
jgi:membrane protein YqaA with SNARE-associated domain